MPKKILLHDQARGKLFAGLNILADAVRITLGPSGKTVALENRYGAPTVINSGVIVAREIELPDPFENMGAQMAREVASRTSEMAGDGTTTATILAQAMVQHGMKYVAAGFDPMEIKRGIDAAVGAMIVRLHANARKLASTEETINVGTISANGDRSIGEMIAQAMERVGPAGVIKAEEGRGLANELEVVEGMQFDRGYLSAYFINDQEKGRVLLDDPFILVCDKPVSAMTQLVHLLEQVARLGKPLLLVAPEVEGEALAMLVVNAMSGVLKACAVRAPGFGDNRRHLLEDIVTVTGDRLVSDETGLALDKVTIEDLGHARRVEVDRDSTAIIGGAGGQEKIRQRIELLKQQANEVGAIAGKAQFEERAARLAGGVALIRVGASTETEMKEKRSRVEDALHATRAAVLEGISPGGGVALLRARAVLDDLHLSSPAQQAGVRVVHRAVEEPLRQIVSGTGKEPDVVLDAVLQLEGNAGYNAATGVFGDMIAMGVIDPVKVTRLALTHAASIASLLLTTECLVAEVPAPPMQHEGPDGGMA
nr:chaperonin GroEL [Lacisediminimonas profundi]